MNICVCVCVYVCRAYIIFILSDFYWKNVWNEDYLSYV